MSDEAPDRKISEVAMRYARRGLRVLPLVARAKEPLVPHGVHDASETQRRSARGGRAGPAEHRRRGSLALVRRHIDPRNGGDEALEALEVEHGALPPTVVQRTGSGGAHLIYARPEGLRLGASSPAESISRGRTLHPRGALRASVRGLLRLDEPKGNRIAQPPAWLCELAAARTDSAPAPMQPSSMPMTTLVERARRYLAKCAPAISVSGGAHRRSWSLRKLARGFALDEATTFALLSEWNTTCRPPWSARDLARKVKEAARAGEMPIRVAREHPENRRMAVAKTQVRQDDAG